MSTESNFTPEFVPSNTAIIDSDFVDRRNPDNQRKTTGLERRQFTNSFSEISQEAGELGGAIDQYKLINRRRFINYEELLSVIKSLGYEKKS